MVYFPTFTSDLVRFTGVKAGLECMISCVSTRKMIIIMRGEPSLVASGVTVLNI